MQHVPQTIQTFNNILMIFAQTAYGNQIPKDNIDFLIKNYY